MSVTDELDSLRQAVEGCQLVAYADIDAGLVLVSSSATRASREVLDSLCAEAAGVFAAADMGDEADGLTTADIGLSLSGDSTRLFLRDVNEGSDAICIVCDPQTDVDLLLTRARTSLPHIFGALGDGA